MWNKCKWICMNFEAKWCQNCQHFISRIKRKLNQNQIESGKKKLRFRLFEWISKMSKVYHSNVIFTPCTGLENSKLILSSKKKMKARRTNFPIEFEFNIYDVKQISPILPDISDDLWHMIHSGLGDLCLIKKVTIS